MSKERLATYIWPYEERVRRAYAEDSERFWANVREQMAKSVKVFGITITKGNDDPTKDELARYAGENFISRWNTDRRYAEELDFIDAMARTMEACEDDQCILVSAADLHRMTRG